MPAISQPVEKRGALVLIFLSACVIAAPVAARADTQESAPRSLRGTGSFRVVFGQSLLYVRLPLRNAAGEQTLSIDGIGLQLGLSYFYNVSDHFAVGGSTLGHMQMLSLSGVQSVPDSSGSLYVLTPVALGGTYRPSSSENGGLSMQVGWTFVGGVSAYHGPMAVLSLVGVGNPNPVFGFTFWYAPLLYHAEKGSVVLSGQDFAANGPGWMFGLGVIVGMGL